MYFDRQLQRSILLELRKNYPDEVEPNQLPDSLKVESLNETLYYLGEHGLVDCDSTTQSEFREPDKTIILSARITAEGLDFLEDDGGLSAILGKVVVKFDDDDLAQLIRAIELSDSPKEDKAKFISIMKTLPAEGLKTVYTRLLNLGLDNLQDVFRLIQTL